MVWLYLATEGGHKYRISGKSGWKDRVDLDARNLNNVNAILNKIGNSHMVL